MTIKKRIALLIFTTLLANANAEHQKEQPSKLFIALARYESLTGKQVDVSSDIRIHAAEISKQLKKNYYQYGHYIDVEEELKRVNVGLFHLTQEQVIASWIKPNYQTARECLKMCKESQASPYLFYWGLHEAFRYQKIVPELKVLSDQYNAAESSLESLYMQYEEYKIVKERWDASLYSKSLTERQDAERDKVNIFNAIHKLIKDKPEFKERAIKRGKAKFELDIQTLEIMIDDYENREKHIPYTWIEMCQRKNSRTRS